MKYADLNDADKKTYDQIVDEMMEEIEKIPPLKGMGNVLSCKWDSLKRPIEKKYIPQLQKVLEDAEKRLIT